MHQASMWLCIMHHYGSMLCIYGSMMRIWHQYSLMLCISYQYGSMLCIRHYYGTIWPNTVQALIYGPVMCIRHQNVAQTCAIYINKARWGGFMTWAVHHAWIWLNTEWFITLNLLHHILSTFFFAINFCLRLTLATNKVAKKAKLWRSQCNVI